MSLSVSPSAPGARSTQRRSVVSRIPGRACCAAAVTGSSNSKAKARMGLPCDHSRVIVLFRPRHLGAGPRLWTLLLGASLFLLIVVIVLGQRVREREERSAATG